MYRLTGRAGVEQRKRIRERDGYTCQYNKCGRVINKGEVDHIISLEDGGNNDDENLQLLCLECHLKKTAKDRKYIDRSGVNESGIPLGINHHWNT